MSCACWILLSVACLVAVYQSADGSLSANRVPQQTDKQATKHALSQGASVFENCISALSG